MVLEAVGSRGEAAHRRTGRGRGERRVVCVCVSECVWVMMMGERAVCPRGGRGGRLTRAWPPFGVLLE